MSLLGRRHVVLLCLMLPGLAFGFRPVRGAVETFISGRSPPTRRPSNNYDETWAYYQQARIDSYQVYVWSRLILDCRREMAEKPADRITALDEHLGRMKKLEALDHESATVGIRPLVRRGCVGVLPPRGRILAGAREVTKVMAIAPVRTFRCAATPGIRFAGDSFT